ncbi:hypothetical protein CYY_005671 [Polysphondylium violaceum]|uniref:Carbohydrate binding domain-containing protein n=1 Tax=Polysphondylium violaceum TaxID=133409 RepID=A0A8J4PTV9_9MYCE|nr:hypothetical protein CYY_005671 [Polysphondylium violaceum]
MLKINFLATILLITLSMGSIQGALHSLNSDWANWLCCYRIAFCGFVSNCPGQDVMACQGSTPIGTFANRVASWYTGTSDNSPSLVISSTAGLESFKITIEPALDNVPVLIYSDSFKLYTSPYLWNYSPITTSLASISSSTIFSIYGDLSFLPTDVTLGQVRIFHPDGTSTQCQYPTFNIAHNLINCLNTPQSSDTIDKKNTVIASFKKSNTYKYEYWALLEYTDSGSSTTSGSAGSSF